MSSLLRKPGETAQCFGSSPNVTVNFVGNAILAAELSKNSIVHQKLKCMPVSD